MSESKPKNFSSGKAISVLRELLGEIPEANFDRRQAIDAGIASIAELTNTQITEAKRAKATRQAGLSALEMEPWEHHLKLEAETRLNDPVVITPEVIDKPVPENHITMDAQWFTRR